MFDLPSASNQHKIRAVTRTARNFNVSTWLYFFSWAGALVFGQVPFALRGPVPSRKPFR